MYIVRVWPNHSFSFWFWKVAWINSITSASFWKSFLAAPPPLTLALLRDETWENQRNTTNADPTKQWETFAIWLLPTHLGVEFELLTDPPLLALLLLVIPPTIFNCCQTCYWILNNLSDNSIGQHLANNSIVRKPPPDEPFAARSGVLAIPP